MRPASPRNSAGTESATVEVSVSPFASAATRIMRTT